MAGSTRNHQPATIRRYGPVVVPLAPPEFTLLVAPPSVVGCEPANDVAPLTGATCTVS